MSQFYQFSADDLTGNTVDFGQFANKVVLIVNTASECGFTPQFAGLQALHEQYKDQGLVVIGFPCNQFGHQEPNEGQAIAQFCQRNYGVDFLMMQKIDVNGKKAHPLYQWLVSQKGGFVTDAIKWNFTKFLIGKNGEVLERFAPTTKPESLENAIQSALQK